MISKLFVIDWVGPFSEIEELKKWEKHNNTMRNYYFYIISGKPYNMRNYRSYCGITQNKDGYVYKRYQCDPNHKIHTMRDKEIWIGRFSDNSAHSRSDIELCETMIVSYWQPELNNKKKSTYPSSNIVLINRWFKTDLVPRQNNIYIAQKMSDLIILDESGIWGTERVRKLVDFDL